MLSPTGCSLLPGGGGRERGGHPWGGPSGLSQPCDPAPLGWALGGSVSPILLLWPPQGPHSSAGRAPWKQIWGGGLALLACPSVCFASLGQSYQNASLRAIFGVGISRDLSLHWQLLGTWGHRGLRKSQSLSCLSFPIIIVGIGEESIIPH